MSVSTTAGTGDRRRRPRSQRRRDRVRAVAAALALAVAAGASAAGAGTRQLAARHFTAVDGLVQDDVQVLLRDPTGYLWAGTRDGISRFDGHRFLTVPLPAGTGSAVVTGLASLPGGPLVGYASGEVRRWDGSRLVAPWPETALPRAPVRAFAPAADGGVLVGTDRGLWRCTGGGCALVSDAAVLEIVSAGADHASWIVTSDGASLLTAAGPRAPALPECPNPCAIAAAAGGPDGTLYVAPAGGGLVTVGSEGVRRRDLDVGGPTALAVAADGTVWLGTRSDLFSWSANGGLSRCLLRAGGGVDVAALLVDREGSLWVGTRGDGLYQVPPGAFELLTSASGLPARSVRAIAAGRGCVFLAAEGGGVATRCGGAWGPALTAAAGEGTALLVLDDGSVLVGTEHGLLRWEAGRGVRPVGVAAAGAGESVAALARSPDGGVWVGTRRGVVRLGPATLAPQGPPPWPLEGEVVALAAGASGALWVALEGQGLFRADGAAVRRVGTGGRVAADRVTSLLVDGRDRLWAGTDGGILVLAPDGSTDFEVAGDALGSRSVLSLAADGSGAVWAGTAHGAARVTPEGTVDRVLTAEDGLAGGGAVKGCAVVDDEGLLWLGSTNGVTVVPVTAGPAGASGPPPVVISSVRSGARTLDGFTPVSSADPGPTAGIAVDGGGGGLELAFEALALAAPGRVRYQWRLVGVDGGWSAPAAARSAAYPPLPTGAYRFEVMARDGSGAWATAPLALAVRVRAPWYAAWWARLLGLSLVGLAAAWGLRARARSVDRQRGILEALAAERTLELAEANRKIVDQNRLLAELSRTDPLTGLANRRVLEEMLPVEMAVLRREVAGTPRGVPLSPRGLVVFVLDLDHFKSVNDRHGHDMGDTYLRVAADSLRRVLREIDVAIRWGGEELVVLGRALDRLGAVALARRLMEVIAASELEGRDGSAIRTTVSVGFCPYPLAGSGMLGSGSWGRLVEVADRLMYEAKRRGRARACGLVYAPGPRRGIDEREVLERLLADPAAPAPGLEFVEIGLEDGPGTSPRTWPGGA